MMYTNEEIETIQKVLRITKSRLDDPYEHVCQAMAVLHYEGTILFHELTLAGNYFISQKPKPNVNAEFYKSEFYDKDSKVHQPWWVHFALASKSDYLSEKRRFLQHLIYKLDDKKRKG